MAGELQDVMVGMFLGPGVIKKPTSCGSARSYFFLPQTARLDVFCDLRDVTSSPLMCAAEEPPAHDSRGIFVCTSLTR